MKTGTVLRDEGVARVDRATSEAWKRRADAAILALATLTRRGFLSGTFTAEDVRRMAGARFLTAVRRGIVEPVYWGHATRPAAHSCRLRHYRGVA